VKRVLVVCTGRPHAAVVARVGGFGAWFERRLSPRVEVRLADARAPLPPPGRFDGIVLTGSMDSVTAWTPRMDALRAVQFHLEFDLPCARAVTELDRATPDAARPAGCALALGSLRATPDADRILGNWLAGYLGA
jgi:hypothetical protein